MKKIGKHEPTKEELLAAKKAHRISLVSYSCEFEKLDSTDSLPRYNRLRIKIQRISEYPSALIFLTVRRHESRIGDENYYTVPMFAEDLNVGMTAEYDLLSFDSFNERFDSISVEMCEFSDYLERRVAEKHIERARRFAELIDRNSDWQTKST